MRPRPLLLCIPAIVLFAIGVTSFAADSAFVTISPDGKGVCAKADGSDAVLFRDDDPVKVFTWAMTHHRVTVIDEGTYKISEPISIPRPGISLVIDEKATIDLNVAALPRVRPYAPRIPVVYNQGHDNVTVINLGNLLGQARKRGTGIFYDGRREGKLGVRGGRIVHAGMMGWTTAPKLPRVNKIVSLTDCENVEVPLLFGDGFRIALLEAEGCQGLDIGLAVCAPRASSNPIILEGLNDGTRVRRLIANQPLKSGVLVRNSPNTTVERAEIYGDPVQFVQIVHPHEYGNFSARFTQRPFIPDSNGSLARKETIERRQVAHWKQSVEMIDFPRSLPSMKVKVQLDAVFDNGDSERIIDKTYDLDLLCGKTLPDGEEPLFLSADGGIIRATGARSKKIRFKDADARNVIQWAMNHSPITVLTGGLYTVGQLISIPRGGVSLVVTPKATLRQDPKILPDVMPGGRGGYRPLIYNPGHDGVSIVNLGTLRPYAGHRSVGVHFDGRSDRTKDRKTFIESGKKGTLNIDGGMIFATGPMYADDVIWIADAKNVRIPLLLARGYTNAPLAIEGSEDMKIGTLAALMGAKAFENEAVDFNSFCQRIHIGRVIGTMPTEEVVDVNNSRDCIIGEVHLYRTVGDIMPMRIHNWPDPQGRSPKLISKRSLVRHSKNSICLKGLSVEKEILEWRKDVELTPLAKTFPRVELRVRLSAVFKDGTRQQIVDERFTWTLH